MRFLLHFTAAALLLAIGSGGMTSAAAADHEARTAVAGRQKIREEVSKALEKGYLTRMDQYRILLHAKEVLTDDDLHGLELTLNRIATRQATARPATAQPAASAVRSETPARQDTGDSDPQVVTPSKYEESKAAETPAIGGPVPTKAKAVDESPFVEEVPAGIGKPNIHLDSDDPEGCPCDEEDCCSRFRGIDIDVISAVDGFKGPMDIADSNGNFGLRLTVNAAVPILPRLGVALQGGTSVIVSDLKGSYIAATGGPNPATGATRQQIFTTVGMFQRITREEGAFTWGFAYDWLFDDYFSEFNFGQWRVKAAWEFNPCDEIGIQASVPEHGSSDTTTVFDGFYPSFTFRPIAQGCLYWKHTWCNDASLTGRFGVAERPGEFVFGAESRVPLTKHIALTSDFSYIMPTEPGSTGTNPGFGGAQEVWNVSVGIEFVLGGFGHRCAAPCQPFLPVADNGSFAIRETDNGTSQ